MIGSPFFDLVDVQNTDCAFADRGVLHIKEDSKAVGAIALCALAVKPDARKSTTGIRSVRVNVAALADGAVLAPVAIELLHFRNDKGLAARITWAARAARRSLLHCSLLNS